MSVAEFVTNYFNETNAHSKNIPQFIKIKLAGDRHQVKLRNMLLCNLTACIQPLIVKTSRLLVTVKIKRGEGCRKEKLLVLDQNFQKPAGTRLVEIYRIW